MKVTRNTQEQLVLDYVPWFWGGIITVFTLIFVGVGLSMLVGGELSGLLFLVIGGGELKDALMREAQALGVQDHIVFTGWVQDMPSIYRALDVVALTSLNEGTPVTLIEAMAAGVPVVATEVGGVGDLMGDVKKKTSDGYDLAGHGILVPSGDGEILSKALHFCLENKEVSREMAARAKEFVLERYSMDRLTRDLESLYGEVLTREG